MENNTHVLNIQAILNVGLCSDNDGSAMRRVNRLYSESMRLAEWYRFAKGAGGQVVLHNSGEEPTLVITLDRLPCADLLPIAATDQNCIAVYYPTLRKGCLLGPEPEKYTPWLRELFVMPNGASLSSDINIQL